MTNFIAYLIAIVSVYWKHLLILLALIVTAGIFLYAPTKKNFSERMPEPAPLQVRETDRPKPPGFDQAGRRYISLEELKAAAQANGYLPIGYFGNNWPAVVTEALTDRDSIEFVRKDGSRHRYTGLDGYNLKAVRLENSDHQETLIVFRSERKR